MFFFSVTFIILYLYLHVTFMKFTHVWVLYNHIIWLPKKHARALGILYTGNAKTEKN